MTSFWTAFNPDLEDPEPPPAPAEIQQLLHDLRLHTAPWGTDEWELPTPPASDDSPSEPDSPASSSTRPSTPSDIEEDAAISGAPIKLRLQPGLVHLIDPQAHAIDPDFEYPDPAVEVCGPLFLNHRDKRYLREITTYGVNLPRPANAPSVFRQTRPSSAMDKIVRAWKGAGLLVPNRQLKHAMQMFLVPKPDGAVRPIIDYSPWTEFIVAPHFSLLSAGGAVRKISPYAHMVKVDLKSGFH